MLLHVHRKAHRHHSLHQFDAVLPLALPSRSVDEKLVCLRPIAHFDGVLQRRPCPCTLNLRPRGVSGCVLERGAELDDRLLQSQRLIPHSLRDVSTQQSGISENVRREARVFHFLPHVHRAKHVPLLRFDANHQVVGHLARHVADGAHPLEDPGGVVKESRAGKTEEGHRVMHGLRPHRVFPHSGQKPQRKLDLVRADDGADEVEISKSVPPHAVLPHPVGDTQRARQLARSAVATDEDVVIRSRRFDAHQLHDAKKLPAFLRAIRTQQHAGVHQDLERVIVRPDATAPHATKYRERILEPTHPRVSGHQRVVEDHSPSRDHARLANHEHLGPAEPPLRGVKVGRVNANASDDHH
mmetsp:Transcript_70245/g.195524  ORF Transcript_70245/g.195524 Transcript_70245/m.195524 type:complete len:355 (-) Transcript_70245:1354-2418(-)